MLIDYVNNLNAQARQVLTDEMLTPKTPDRCATIDWMKLMSVSLESLELLRPFGMAFEKPVYMLEDLSATTVTENRSSEKSYEIGIDG